MVERYSSPPGRLIDAGCGEGFFLQQATQSGWDAEGIDYSLKSHYPAGVKVAVGRLDERGGLPFPDGSADVVTCWAVIEHVRDPHQAVREIHRLLKPGGYLFLDTPLCDDWSERFVQARSHWFHPPEHLHVFSARGLRQVVERSGFRVVRHSPFFERSMLRWCARRGRNIVIGVLAGGLNRIIRPGRWRADRIRRSTPIGDIQLIVAKKGEGAG
jgi:SAM-dependent methyltransferase